MCRLQLLQQKILIIKFGIVVRRISVHVHVRFYCNTCIYVDLYITHTHTIKHSFNDSFCVSGTCE